MSLSNSITLLVDNKSIFAIDSEYLRGVAHDTDLNLRNLTDGKELVVMSWIL